MELFPMLKQTKFNMDAIKKEYEAHAFKCQQIAKEINKWGKKTALGSHFLKSNKS